MKLSYINPEEFSKQLAEKKQSVEAIAEILEIEISLAKNIFSGHKSISNFEILKLHELAGFSYPNLITKDQTKDINQVKPEKTQRLGKYIQIYDPEFNKTHLPVYKKTLCEKCNLLIISPVNYCPYCGILLPHLIRRTNIDIIKNEPSDELLYLNSPVFNNRINQLQLSLNKVYKRLNINKSDFFQMLSGHRSLHKDEQKILIELLRAPIGYFAGREIK